MQAAGDFPLAALHYVGVAGILGRGWDRSGFSSDNERLSQRPFLRFPTRKSRSRPRFRLRDGVYELVPVLLEKAIPLDEHLRRLQVSLDNIRLTSPHGLPSGAT